MALYGDGVEIRIERDDDCDCPWWLRWRIVSEERTLGRQHDAYEIIILAHTRTKIGAVWTRWRLSRRLLGSDDVLI